MNTENDTDETPEVRHKRLRAQAFRIAIELIGIFGAPAVAAFFGGQYLDGIYESGRTITFILLGCAFIFSWIITIWRVRHLSRQFDNTEGKMKSSDASDEKNKDR